MSFWTDLETTVETEANKVWGDIVAIEKELAPLAIATAEDIGKAALQAVLGQAPALLSGKEKMAAAVAFVINLLATQGKAAVATLIEAAIQAAYNMISTIIPAQKSALVAHAA